MAGTLTVVYTFASQSGSIPLSDLDSNFSSAAAYINALAATSTQVQNGTVSALYITPAVAGSHKSAAKAWASWTGTSTGTITAAGSYNVASIVREGTGTYSIAFTTAFADTTYPVVGSADEAALVGPTAGSRATGGIKISVTASGAASDSAGLVSFTAYGTQ